MSASSLPSKRVDPKALSAANIAAPLTFWQFLKLCGSLKITVVMFFLAIWLVFFGTLAQDEQDLRQVKDEYFTSFVAVVPFDVMVPTTIWPHENRVPGAFLFPGGAFIGLVLMINLIAAKVTRFHVSAKGSRLVGGILLSLFGAGLVVAVIVAGNQTEGLQGKPPIEYATLWNWLKFGISLLTVVAVAAALLVQNLPSLARISLWTTASVMVMLSVFLVSGGESVRLDDPGLRIVWQLFQSSVAAMVTLVGLWMVFGNRGGNVLIHIGVGLLMLGQFIFGDRQIEQRISLQEGQETNIVFLQGEVELAVIDASDPKEDKVVAIPESRVLKAADTKEVIDAPELPIKLKIVEFMRNSTVKELKEPDPNNLATGGLGLTVQAEKVAPNGGASSKPNVSSAYVEVIDKASGKSLGTHLLSQFFNDQRQLFMGAPPDQNESITVDGKQYELALRYRREYKPYTVYLKDVQRDDYEASERVRDFSSHVVIKDHETNSEFNGHIWMNNPVRYRNESFYQSEYNSAMIGGQRIEMTGLQVVANQGWVIPYVSCMLVLFGMASHFTGTFLRFASRLDRGAIPSAHTVPDTAKGSRTMAFVIASVIGVVTAGYFYSSARVPKAKDTEADWVAIGRLPAMHEGRIKPLDTVARNILQSIGEPLFGATPQPKDSSGMRRSGTTWLVSLMADEEWPADSPIFRVYSQEARDYFGLKKREGYLYSYNQLKDKAEELRATLRNKEKLTPEEEKLAHILRKVQMFDIVAYSYKLPPLPNENDFQNTQEGLQRFSSQLRAVMEHARQLEASNPPALIPPPAPEEGQPTGERKWQAFSPAIINTYIAQRFSNNGAQVNPAILKFTELLDAVREHDPSKMNLAAKELAEYEQKLPGMANSNEKASFEAWFNYFAPTNRGVAFYLIAFVLGLVGIMSQSRSVRWTTFALILVTFALHTIAILCRIYISGRPPVVNLYSSAVFIGGRPLPFRWYSN